MNKYQAIALLIAIANLPLVLLLPPFDYISPTRGNVPTFEGFALTFDDCPNRVVNASFLQLVIFVILANAAIAWLLLKDASRDVCKTRFFSRIVNSTRASDYEPKQGDAAPSTPR